MGVMETIMQCGSLWERAWDEKMGSVKFIVMRRSEQKLFQFLNAVDYKHDNIKRELLRLETLPTVEGAYAAIRKENAHHNIFSNKTEVTNHSGIASGLLAPVSKSKEPEGHSLVSKNQCRSDYSSINDKDNLKCDECGMKRHTKDQCFRIVGYPEWWNNGHKKGRASIATTTAVTGGNHQINNSGTTTAQGGFGLMAAEQPSLSTGEGFLTRNQFQILQIDPSPNFPLYEKPNFDPCSKINPLVDVKFPYNPSRGKTSLEQSHYAKTKLKVKKDLQGQSSSTNNVSFTNIVSNKPKNKEWIIDCGATDTMTFDKNDFHSESKTSKTQIKMANGGNVQVKGGGTIEISPTLKLKNCLYVPSLSHKLLSDIKIGKIVGRGTERDGLYYVDEVTQDGIIMRAHGTSNRQAWLWHRRLGHPSAGIIHQTTCPHTPQQNGVSERKNRILLEITRALMIESNVPRSFWPEALATTTYLVNRLPTRALELKNPLETLAKFYKLPSNLTLKPRIFGCTVFIHIQKGERTKLDPCAEKCVFVSYGGESDYSDTVSWLDLPSSEEVTHNATPPNNPPTGTNDNDLPNHTEKLTSAIYSEEIPTSVEQALKSPKWRKAMENEMEALTTNNTWEKCILPESKKPVGTGLVAKGYTQTYGVDYSENFSSVAKIDTIRVLFSVAANKDWPLHQFDVKNAFLHGDLKEEVYMEGPPGFTSDFREREVCLLKKSLYSLKQSPRAWFGRFTIAMENYGFKQSNSDHTLFLKQRNNLITCLIIYVDDMIITGNDQEEISKLKTNLFKEFEMKDLGGLKYFLGIEVLRSRQGIFICQKKYILDLLAETCMINYKPDVCEG
ncbi:uncharacterized protein [Rutidosis leptorrhynchoides]|uniref:uncharacterized protein n=1 Tax=Rutidosis leptorrhynchoides TaxID=125765 RepID=UPI003A9A0EFE